MTRLPITRRLMLISMSCSLMASVGLGQTFAPELLVSEDSVGSRAVEAADIDGDGDMDLFSAELNGQRVVWYEQLSEDVFSPARVIATGTAGAMFESVGDADGDGTPDVVVSDWFGDTVILYLNQNNGSSWVTVPLATNASGASSLTMTDFDLDGDMDVAAALELKSDVWSFENLSGGVFGAGHSVAPGFGGAHALAAGDLDSDGLPDLVIGGWNAQELAWLRNLGGLSFASKAVFDTDVVGISCLKTADLDEDGDLDVLSATRTGDEVAWYPNDGAGQLGPMKLIAAHGDPYWVASADVDNDGDQDVFVAVSGAYQVAWHKNQGGGQFGPTKKLFAKASGFRYVALADMDGDDDIDLIGSSSSEGTVSLYRNILTLKDPQLLGITGLHCLDSGSVTLTGENLLDTTVSVDGVLVPIVSANKKKLVFALQPDVPGGLRDILLTNPFGSEFTPNALVRYPSLSGPGTVSLGKAVYLKLDNGELGTYILAVSGAIYSSPAPFTSFGWYYGLELNGVWVVEAGTFALGGVPKSVKVTGVLDPGLVGVPFYFQAWTTQTVHGSAGFTAVHAVSAK